MKTPNGVPARRPEKINNHLRKFTAKMMVKHKDLMDRLAKYD